MADRNTINDDRPIVLIHRISSYDDPTHITDLLIANNFQILDPHQHSPHAPPLSFARAAVIYDLCPLAADTLRLLPSLQLVVCTSVGTDHVDLAACRRRGIAVANAGPAFTDDAADYAVALLIDVLRRVSAADRYVRAGLWPWKGHYALGSKVGGKRVGIVGLGKIGSAVSQRLAAFGCSIAYSSRNEKPSVPFPYYASVRDLASESDVLVVCCALTDATRHIIDKDVMRALGKDGVIINVGRGALVDEQELVRSLTQGELGGAGLDVFENEPDVPEELLGLDNVVLSPHSAVVTPESLEAVSQIVLANLKAFFSNKPLVSPIKQD